VNEALDKAYLNCCLSVDDEIESDTKLEPKSWKAAVRDPRWKLSMQAEFDALLNMESWTYEKPDHTKPILRSHWVFKHKNDNRRKSRLTVDGSDHFCADTYASVGTKQALRMTLSLAVTQRLKTRHWDVTNAFLYGKLKESEYVQMRQPMGMEKMYAEDGTELICLLKKSLYGLKTAPRIWQTVLETVLASIDFEHYGSIGSPKLRCGVMLMTSLQQDLRIVHWTTCFSS